MKKQLTKIMVCFWAALLCILCVPQKSEAATAYQLVRGPYDGNTEKSSPNRKKVGNGYIWQVYNPKTYDFRLYCATSKTGKGHLIEKTNTEPVPSVVTNGSYVFWAENKTAGTTNIYRMKTNGSGKKVYKKIKDPVVKKSGGLAVCGIYGNRIYLKASYYDQTAATIKYCLYYTSMSSSSAKLVCVSQSFYIELASGDRYIYGLDPKEAYKTCAFKVFDCKTNKIVKTVTKNSSWHGPYEGALGGLTISNGKLYYPLEKGSTRPYTVTWYRVALNGNNREKVLTLIGGINVDMISEPYIYYSERDTYSCYNMKTGKTKKLTEKAYLNAVRTEI